jgi:hypothetical protein
MKPCMNFYQAAPETIKRHGRWTEEIFDVRLAKTGHLAYAGSSQEFLSLHAPYGKNKASVFVDNPLGQFHSTKIVGTPVVRLRILGRLKKLAADAEAEIRRARDHKHLRAGMMKLMTFTAMIDAAYGHTPGQQRSPERSSVTFVARQAGVG